MSVRKIHETTQPLQKNQVYNWFDRYKPKSQASVYLLNSEETHRSQSLRRFFKTRSER